MKAILSRMLDHNHCQSRFFELLTGAGLRKNTGIRHSSVQRTRSVRNNARLSCLHSDL